jgi:DNA-binding transcriptional regulator YhcF (GntR family)
MSWKFTNDSPIYTQIMDEIKLRIAKGDLKPGDKVPPVRELALKAGVNPNTMQKALSELEREGVLASQRTSGRYVATAEDAANNLKKDIVNQYIQAYLSGMGSLGYSNSEAVCILKKHVKNEEDTYE